MMKYIYQLTLLLFTIASLSSCEKFLDVNDNPNAPGASTLPLNTKFPAALVATVNQESLQLNQIGAFWGGYWGNNNDGLNSFVDLKTYNGPGLRHQRDGIPVWENGFNNLLYFQLIREEAEQEGELFYSGASKIMQGWLFLRLVDVYNNIPFDDALQGTKNPTPRYEDGKTVYAKAVNLITEGIADMKASTAIAAVNSGDILFKGDKTLWVKFANTVKLRALIRQSEANNPTYITTEIAKIVQEGSGFLTTGQHAFVQPGYLNTSGKLNPFWESYYRNVQGAITTNYQIIRPTVYAIEQYQQRNDPRLSNLYTQINGNYKGTLFGNPNSAPAYEAANTSALKGRVENNNQPAAIFKNFNQPSVLMGSFESLFLQAEAAQRGWIIANPKELYEKAIQESFLYMEVPVSAFNLYNLQPSVNLDLATNKIERIVEQKWLALNSINSIEAWSEHRRLGVPNFPNSLDAASPNIRPLRFMYPETERMTNNQNASLQGDDNITTAKVWWDN